jgi:hypothetical protein
VLALRSNDVSGVAGAFHVHTSPTGTASCASALGVATAIGSAVCWSSAQLPLHQRAITSSADLAAVGRNDSTFDASCMGFLFSCSYTVDEEKREESRHTGTRVSCAPFEQSSPHFTCDAADTRTSSQKAHLPIYRAFSCIVPSACHNHNAMAMSRLRRPIYAA